MDDSALAHEPDPGDLPSTPLSAENPSRAVRFWRDYGQRLLAALLVLTLAWLTYTQDGWVPIVSAADLGDQSGAGHDGHYLLGPEVLDALDATDAIAFAVHGLSVVVFALALGMALAPLIAPRFVAWRYASEQARLRQRRKTLPVKEPRNPVKPSSMPSPAASGTDRGHQKSSRDRQE